MIFSSLYRRYRDSLQTRLIVNVIIIHAVLMSLVVYDLIERERQFMQEQLSHKGYEKTTLLISHATIPLLNNDLVALDELLDDRPALKDHYMTFILDKHGRVRASTKKEYFNKQLNDPLSREQLTHLSDSDLSIDQIIHDDLVDTIGVITVNDAIIGYVRTIIDRSTLSQELSIMTNKGMFYVLLAILIGALFAWIVVRQMTRQLNLVASAAEQIANKDFNVDLPVTRNNDELAKMIAAFKVMSESIQEYVDELQKSNTIIYQEKELAEVTLRSIGDCVIVTDAYGKVKFINPPAEEILLYTNAEAADKKIETLFTIFQEGTAKQMESPLYTSIREERVVSLSNHTTLINREGRPFFIEDSSAPIKNAEGVIEGAILVFHDVTEKKKSEKALQWQATHDALTKLHNRTAFQTTLKNTVRQATHDNTHHAVLFMDLDKFKRINDTVGHLAGDEVLKQAAFLLRKSVREEDYLCRFGGDEFALILFDCDTAMAEKWAQKLIDTILEHTFYWNEKNFKIGLSVGIAEVNAGNSNVTAILSQADLACYLAKEKGRNRFYVAQKSDLDQLDNLDELQWISRIANAIKENHFRLYIQKIKDLSGNSDHYEILLRLIEDGETVLYPDFFLPQAERLNLMPKIDRYVIEEFFRWFTLNKKELSETLCFSVNITGQSISDNTFVDDILLLADQYHMDCSRVIFEITENTAISNLNEAQYFFNTLSAKGFRFSLDDFGTGLSSFAYLKLLPVTFLKIDGIFVKDIINDKIDRGMVESIYRIGSLMGLKIIAEYAETDAIITELTEMGVHYAQGYAIEKPHPIDDILT
ncbi:MAG: EAL domain-containing protein [Helicobacteraceae bacterium]|jgi:diguanylate cyclase (GGDEF)-like protein/PAS domain S-box-containing protein|nr:EAL domain-containing protein [Helicobacteraceae bacterium]